jgi:DNA end-binding protein Ku
MFVPARSVDWIWYDKPHYLVPDDPVGEEAFVVIRNAMESTRMVAISRLVLYRRERAVMLEPRGKGIVLWTLRYGDEVRDPDDYFGTIGGTELEPDLMNLVMNLIEERTKPWDTHMADDPVQARLIDIIASKKKGTKPRVKGKAEPQSAPSNVISIMDALRKSISSDAKQSKRRRD